MGAMKTESAEAAAASAPDSSLVASTDTIAWLTAGEIRVQVVERPESHGHAGFGGGAADVRHQERVGKDDEPLVDVRLVVVRVDAGGPQLARRERVDERIIVDEGAAGGVDED